MMKSAELIDGRTLAQQWRDDIAVQVRALNVPLGLAAVCVGGDDALRAFVKIKEKAAASVGVEFSNYFIDADDEQSARKTLAYLAGDDSVHGIFVELPLPVSWNSASFLSLIPAVKDVDALTAHPLVPAPAVHALEYVCVAHDIAVNGMTAAVVGHGRLVGEPVAKWLHDAGAITTVINVDTTEPAKQCAEADLVVTGVGRPGLVTADWIKEGAKVIDFGYSDGKGDVDAISVKKKAGLLSPVPGGMGPLVVAAVLENLLKLATI